MLKPPKLAGVGQLRLLVDDLGFDWSCKVIDVHPSTLRGWLRGARPVPQAALQALYWLTSWGFSDACAEAHWSHQYLVFKVRELEERLAALRSGRPRLPVLHVPGFAGGNNAPITCDDGDLQLAGKLEIRRVVRREVERIGQFAQQPEIHAHARDVNR